MCQVINVGGNRIGTEEIESALLVDAGREGSPLRNCVVVGMPDELLGTVPVAFLVLQPGSTFLEADESRLRTLTESRLGSIAVPAKFVLTSEMPETYSGKFMRRLLQTMLEQKPLGDLGALKNPSCVEPLQLALREAFSSAAQVAAPLDSDGAIDALAWERVMSLPEPERLPELERLVVEAAQRLCAGDVDGQSMLLQAGMTSLNAVKLAAVLRATTGIPLPGMLVFKYRSPREISAHIANSMSTANGKAPVSPAATRPPELGSALPLHFNEASLVQKMAPAISIVNFFRGDPDAAAEHLRSRLDLVLDTNPWLAGRLKLRGQSLELHVPDAVALEERREATFRDVSIKALYPGMRVEQMNSLLASEKVKGAWGKCVGRDEPLFRLVLIRTQPSSFAVLFTLSHTIADGHTAYRLYEMLGDSGVRAVPLEARREASYMIDDLETSVDLELNFRVMRRVSTLVGIGVVPILATALNVWSVSLDSRLINPAWLDALTAQYNSSAPPGEHVSPHDALLFWFLRRCDVDVGHVMLNMRNIAPGVTDDHAGNYSAAFCLSREHLVAPAQVTVSNLMRNERRRGDEWPHPSLSQRLYPRWGIVTNWCQITRELVLPGCEQVMSMPLLSAMPAPHGSVGIAVFQATKDQLGLFVMGRRPLLDHVLSEEGAFCDLPRGAAMPTSEKPDATAGGSVSRRPSRSTVVAAATAVAAAAAAVVIANAPSTV